MIPDQLTFEAFCEQFSTDEACANALFQARWPHGFRCRDCRHPSYSHITTRRLPLYECRSCGLQTSIIAGTIMEGSSTPLPRWFQAMFLLSQPGGISSVNLAKTIRVTYKTAWLISRKIRHALEQADNNEPLTGAVQVQRNYYGYFEFCDAQQPVLVGASLEQSSEPQQFKIKQPHPSHVSNDFHRWIEKTGLDSFITNHTDGQDVTVVTLQSKLRPVFTRVMQQASDWLNETFHGIGAKHLQAYLDEFCFRLNQKLRPNGTSVFGSMLQWCAVTPSRTYAELTLDKPVLPVPWLAFASKAKWKGRHFRLFRDG